MAFALTPEAEKIVDELLSHYPTKRAACLPVLHLCQRQNGWISADVMDYVARRLELATSEVLGVVTFYTMYHQQPVAPNVVWVCRTLSCELRGARAIQSHLEKRLGCGVGGTSKDRKFTLKTAECLAACGQAPMVQINDAYYEDLTIEKLDRILDEITAKTKTPPSGAAPALRGGAPSDTPSAGKAG